MVPRLLKLRSELARQPERLEAAPGGDSVCQSFSVKAGAEQPESPVTVVLSQASPLVGAAPICATVAERTISLAIVHCGEDPLPRHVQCHLQQGKLAFL